MTVNCGGGTTTTHKQSLPGPFLQNVFYWLYWGIQQEECEENMDSVPDPEAEYTTDFLRSKALFIMKIRDERKLPQVKLKNNIHALY